MILFSFLYRSVQAMQLCSLGQGTVSPWSIVPRCPRVLQVLPTMSDSWECETWDTWELPDIVGSTCNTLRQRGTMLHGETLPCPKDKSCIVWTDLISFSVPPSPRCALGPRRSWRHRRYCRHRWVSGHPHHPLPPTARGHPLHSGKPGCQVSRIHWKNGVILT